jgi:hypothetical protein
VRHASLVLLLCASSVNMSAQENGLSQRPSPAPPATPNLFNTAKDTKPKSAVHPIPLALNYNRYVHEVPLSRDSNYYVHEVSVAVHDQAGTTRLISEKARPIGPN